MSIWSKAGTLYNIATFNFDTKNNYITPSSLLKNKLDQRQRNGLFKFTGWKGAIWQTVSKEPKVWTQLFQHSLPAHEGFLDKVIKKFRDRKLNGLDILLNFDHSSLMKQNLFCSKSTQKTVQIRPNQSLSISCHTSTMQRYLYVEMLQQVFITSLLDF